MRQALLVPLVLVSSLLTAAAQSPTGSLEVVSPRAGEPISGMVTIEVALKSTSNDAVLTFYADGKAICEDVPAASRQCSWNAGPTIKQHLLRVVATLADGDRIVATRRTATVDFAENVRVNVVQVGAIVTDRDGNLVSGLSKDLFRLFDENVPTVISHFSADRVALDLILAMDVSGSMEKALPALKSAVGDFLTSTHPDDSVSLLAFNDSVYNLAEHERDRKRLLAAVDGLKAWGGTALYDALGRALDTLDNGVARRAIVVFTDGADVNSALTLAGLQEKLRASDAMLFIVALGDGTTEPSSRVTLDALADSTGGRVLYVERSRDLRARFQTVLDELSHQYVLGFEPGKVKSNAGKDWRTLRVELTDKKYRVRARRGYRPPAD